MGFWSKVGEGKNYRLINSPKMVQWLFRKLEEVELCAIDIETSHRTASKSMAGQHDVVVGGISMSWQKDQAIYLPLYTGRGDETWWKRDAVFEAIIEHLEDFLAGPCEKVGQNVKFDVAWLHRCFGIVTRHVVFDTMLAHHLLDEEGRFTTRHGLKPMAKYYLDPKADQYEKELKEALKHYDPVHKRYTEVDLDILYPYACSDADYTLQLMHIFEPQLEAEGLLDLFYDIVMPLQHVCMLAEVAGMEIDTDRLEELGAMYAKRRAELQPLIWQTSGFQFDISSPAQVAEVLYQRLGLPTQFGKKGSVSTDKDALDALKGMHPVIEPLREYRSVEKLNSGYVDGVRKRIDPETGRLHPTFSIHGTVTGRLSSEDPNVQNWPRPENGGILIKSMFVAPPDHKIVMADYSQAELRVAAHCSKETAWITAFRNGADIHSQTAKQCYNLDCAVEEVSKRFKEYRSRAKTINFGIIYGMSKYGLAPKLQMEVDEADAFIAAYFDKLPELKAWIDATHKLAMQLGYVVNPFGRKRRLPDIQLFIPPRVTKPYNAPQCWGRRQESPQIIRLYYPGFDFKEDMDVFSDLGRFQGLARDLSIRQRRFQRCASCPFLPTCVYEVERSFRQSKVNEAKRQSVNSIVQSGASDLTTNSYAEVLAVCQRQGIPISLDPVRPGIRPWNIIHDEVCYIVHNRYVEQVSKIMVDVMMNIFPQCLVPMVVDVEVVERLSDKHEG